MDEHAARSSDLIAARANARRSNAAKHASLSQQAAQRQNSQPARGAQPQQRQDPQSARSAQGRQLGSQPIRNAQAQQVNPPSYERTSNQPSKGIGSFIRQNITYIVSVAVVAFVVVVGLLLIRLVMPATDAAVDKASGETPAPYEHPFDWTCLDLNNGRYRYIVDGQVKSRLGIDVSESQHEIDWDAVAADGIDFAMIRVGYRGSTEGDLYLDEQFWNNLDGARNAGLDCGAYFFSQALSPDEAVEEADFVITYLNGTKLEYPIVFDSEEIMVGSEASRNTGLSVDEMTAIAEAFCNRVEAAGYESMIYGNEYDLWRYRHEVLKSNRIWWAEYGDNTPDFSIGIDMWQYSNSGSVAGISTNVDMTIDPSNAID